MTRTSPRAAGATARLFVQRLEDRDVPALAGNQLFPADNPWNQRIADAPVAANSDAIIRRIDARQSGVGPKVHLDFAKTVPDKKLYGIPVNVVDGTQVPAVPVLITRWADESDHAAVPIPPDAKIEADGSTAPRAFADRGDSHLLIYDKAANVGYELYHARRPSDPGTGTGSWRADVMAIWDFNTNTVRKIGATSADAAGLSILAGLIRADEALPPERGGQGEITHAIRMTVRQTKKGYVFPGSHVASKLTDADLPRMGERFRLKADYPIPDGWSPEAKAIARAMKEYGLIVSDNGGDFFVTGAPSPDWDMDRARQVQGIPASAFEVVDLTPRVTGLSTPSGSVGGGTRVTVSGKNFGGAAGQLRVLFGDVEASSVNVLSDSRLLVVAPPHAAGAVDVRVVSGTTRPNVDGKPVFFGYGTSPVVPAGRFTYGDGPVVEPTAPVLVGRGQFAAGNEAGGVGLYGADNTPFWTAAAFPGRPAGAVRTAAADVNKDGVADVLAGTGPGTAARVRLLDGQTGRELFAADVFEGFGGGVFVAAGDLDGDGNTELVVTPDEGGGPRVLVYRGADFGQAASFFGIDDPAFRGGARAAVGDINGDGQADLIVSAGFGGGPRVAAYDGRSLGSGRPTKLFNDLFVFDPALRNGVYLAAGDLDGDGKADLIAGAGPGGGPRVLALSAADLLAGHGNGARVLANFFAGDVSNRAGVRVAVKDLDGDDRADVLAGDASRGRVSAYLGTDFATSAAPQAIGFEPFPGVKGGVFVG